MFTFHFSVTYDANGDKKPNLKFYVLCNDKIVRGESLAGWSRPDNPIEQLPHIGNQYNKEIINVCISLCYVISLFHQSY